MADRKHAAPRRCVQRATIADSNPARSPLHGPNPPRWRFPPSTAATRAAAEPLRALLSEAGLIRERIRVEAQWLLHLAARGAAAGRRARCRRMPCASARAALAARSGRRRRRDGQGHRGAHQPRRQGGRIFRARGTRARRARAAATLELVHFGCTSEDINNLSYARLLARRARERCCRTLERAHRGRCAQLAHALRATRRCWRARTASRPARPRSARNARTSRRACSARSARWSAVAILGKWNGAVGNFNAHSRRAAGGRLAGASAGSS